MDRHLSEIRKAVYKRNEIINKKTEIIKNQAEILEFKNTKIEQKNRLEGFNKQTKVRISELNEII